ncbi:hypothetical protein [Nitrobacter sp.]|uniref:hypothetical protein n=1 Tax=Nitrobacter sp. TaxID=29420 RepID=UPI0029CAB359|nr:hypothetical protein [Nitrobacter sp.]
MKYPLSAAALAQGIAFVGKTGSGKTTSAKGGIEDVLRHDERARVCILDPTKHDWWGLTSSASGKQPGFPFQILGGPHGHVPLHHTAGKVVGELVGRGELPLSIIDMADFPMGGLQHFFSDFAEALMRSMRGVLYLVLEEAHEFAPKERSGIGNENMSVYWAKKIATAGRTRGIRLMVVTQRTQKLHNDLLGSCETLVAHKLRAPADQKPVKDWLKDNCDTETFERVTETLGKLRIGTAWVCSDEAVATEPTAFPPLKTFDNTKTPDGADSGHQVTMAGVDRERLAAIMGDALVEAEANDPAKLKRRIAELEKTLASKPAPAPDQASIESAYRRGEAAGNSSGYISGYQAGIRAVISAANALPLPSVPTPSPGVAHPPAAYIPDVGDRVDLPSGAKGLVTGSVSLKPSITGPSQSRTAEGVSRPQQRILGALAWLHAVGIAAADRTRVAMLADASPKSSGFEKNVSTLSTKGLIHRPGPGTLALTEDGLVAADPVDIAPNDAALHEAIRRKISGPQWTLLDVLIRHRAPLTRAELAAKAGVSATSSGFEKNVSTLSGFGFVTRPERGSVQAADILFVE